jgi:LPS-assembly lipoprotein
MLRRSVSLPSWRKGLATGFCVGGALLLSGCAGFQPLYAQPEVVKNLAAIQVNAPSGRTGYLIRQHLDDAFAKDHGAAPAYAMDLQLGEARYPRGVRIDNVATRYEYVLTANYALRSLPSGAVAKTGSVRVELTYDSADQPYASIAAQQDAQDRAAEEAARRIELELAVWLANGAKVAQR